LIKRKYPPFRNKWSIPGGFVKVENNESLEETAERELKEETNLKNIYIEQLKTYGNPNRDPRMRIITIVYFALIPANKIKTIKAGDDAKEATWFSFRNLPELAFDHEIILNDLLNRLMGKISYTPIGFELTPKEFTWTELQNVYEIILNRKLLAPNFRRKIKSMYFIEECISTKKLKSAGKPPKYLKFIKEKETFN
jgi:8-oxo-dGTP diphosphatase